MFSKKSAVYGTNVILNYAFNRSTSSDLLQITFHRATNSAEKITLTNSASIKVTDGPVLGTASAKCASLQHRAVFTLYGLHSRPRRGNKITEIISTSSQNARSVIT